MKIGILTFHRAHNYGALLQCYALQHFLEEMGHETFVIDYRQPHVERLYKYSWKRLVKLSCQPKKLIKYIQSKRNYTTFYKHFSLTKPCSEVNVPQDFDAYVVGSDQLWSLDCTGGEDSVFSGFFKRNKKSRLIGYAISVNAKSLKDRSDNRLLEMINNFSTLSFREVFTQTEIYTRCGFWADQVLDPTLLTTASTWSPLLTNHYNKNFVLVYEVRRDPQNPDAIRNKAEKFAKEKKIETVILSDGNVPVCDFVTAFSHCKCVFTSSFHASVFALIFKKPLCAFLLHDGNDNRYESLLRNCGAENFLFELSDEVKDLPKADYREINLCLEKLKESSKKFLEKGLQ